MRSSPENAGLSFLAVENGAQELRVSPTLFARVLLGSIRVYQRIFSPVLPVLFGPACGCRFAPTCSHYAAEAVRTHGALRGAWLALLRLIRCTPLHPGGFDPVPPPRPRCERARVSRAPHFSTLC